MSSVSFPFPGDYPIVVAAVAAAAAAAAVVAVVVAAVVVAAAAAAGVQKAVKESRDNGSLSFSRASTRHQSDSDMKSSDQPVGRSQLRLISQLGSPPRPFLRLMEANMEVDAKGKTPQKAFFLSKRTPSRRPPPKCRDSSTMCGPNREWKRFPQGLIDRVASAVMPRTILQSSTPSESDSVLGNKTHTHTHKTINEK